MKRSLAVTLLSCLLLLCLTAPVFAQAPASGVSEKLSALKTVIAKYLGRPYVWGSSGLKSFDCSGFLWRVMTDNGILIKRTTARKFYMALPPVDESKESSRWQFGTVVFFSDLEHVGIVASPKTFYHAQSSKGTNLSEFDPVWRGKIYGFRSMPSN